MSVYRLFSLYLLPSWLDTYRSRCFTKPCRFMYVVITTLSITLLTATGCHDAPSQKSPVTPENEAHAATNKDAVYKGLLVSNQPLYLLARAATQGVEVPRKIMTGSEIGHHYHIKPSNRKDIGNATDIYWVGAVLETPLTKVLQNNNIAHAIIDHADIKPLLMRNNKSEVYKSHTADPHIWLDPQRAKKIVALIAKQRAERFPEYKVKYEQNVNRFNEQMDAAIAEIQQTKRLESKQSKTRYIAYHDAYQYLESTLGLSFLGSMTNSPELPVTAKQLMWLKEKKQRVVGKQSMCLLSESSHVTKRLNSLEPVSVIEIDESMQSDNEFVFAWKKIATQIMHCHR